VFWVVAAAALLGLIATWRGVEETRSAEARLDSSLGGALKAYLSLLRDWHYLGLVFIGGCAMAGFFVSHKIHTSQNTPNSMAASDRVRAIWLTRLRLL